MPSTVPSTDDAVIGHQLLELLAGVSVANGINSLATPIGVGTPRRITIGYSGETIRDRGLTLHLCDFPDEETD
jgi:hypothetical protein